MPSLTLQERMLQVETWLGVVATRPLREADYRRAHTRPTSNKRAWDGFTYGASYMARHAQRNVREGAVAKGLAQALPVPVMSLAIVALPISVCFIQRLTQKRVRSEDATREDTIAFEFRNANRVADILARDDQAQMLKNVHGTSAREIAAWAAKCMSLGGQTQKYVDQSSNRIKSSRLIRHHMNKMTVSMMKLRDKYK